MDKKTKQLTSDRVVKKIQKKPPVDNPDTRGCNTKKRKRKASIPQAVEQLERHQPEKLLQNSNEQKKETVDSAAMPGNCAADESSDAVEIDDDIYIEPPAKKQRAKKKKPAKPSDSSVTIDFETPGLFLFIGRGKSGKSFCIEHVVKSLWRAGRFKFGIVFSPTVFTKTGGAYYKWITQESGSVGHLVKGSPTNINDGGKLKFSAYLAFIERLTEENNKVAVPNFIIIDDNAGRINYMDEDFVNYVSVARHFGGSIFLGTQDIHKVPPMCRRQADYVFCWGNNSLLNIKAIEDDFSANLMADGRTFLCLLQEAISVKYRCLLINPMAHRRDGEDEFMTYLAPAKKDPLVIRFQGSGSGSNVLPDSLADTNEAEVWKVLVDLLK